MLIKSIQTLILDTLFPIQCLSCQQGEEWLCSACLSKIELLSVQVCPYCEKEITGQGKICPKCHESYLVKNKVIPLDSLMVSSRYTNALLSKIVHYYKYNFIEDLHIPLGKLLVKSLLKNNIILPDLIIPIPLHPRRLRWRGFNQSELLANFISENLTPGLTIPVSNDIICRRKYTSPQMGIKNYSDRQKNIQNAFSFCPLSPVLGRGAGSEGIAGKHRLDGKTVLLIDDIATTGSTLLEAGKLLKQNGAKSVIGTVIARQEYKNEIYK